MSMSCKGEANDRSGQAGHSVISHHAVKHLSFNSNTFISQYKCIGIYITAGPIHTP